MEVEHEEENDAAMQTILIPIINFTPHRREQTEQQPCDGGGGGGVSGAGSVCCEECSNSSLVASLFLARDPTSGAIIMARSPSALTSRAANAVTLLHLDDNANKADPRQRRSSSRIARKTNPGGGTSPRLDLSSGTNNNTVILGNFSERPNMPPNHQHQQQHRPTPRRGLHGVYGVTPLSTDEVQLYRHRFHLVVPQQQNDSPNDEADLQTQTIGQLLLPPNGPPNSHREEVPLPDPSLLNLSSEPSMSQQHQPLPNMVPVAGAHEAVPSPQPLPNQMTPHVAPFFNKYPAPMFVKTVMSAKAEHLRRGLAEGQARRTRVNNDLRDELNRIIQFTKDQRLEQQAANSRRNSLQSRPPTGHPDRRGSKTPEATRKEGKKGISPDQFRHYHHASIGADGLPEYSTEIWPSASAKTPLRPAIRKKTAASSRPETREGAMFYPQTSMVTPTPFGKAGSKMILLNQQRLPPFATPPNSVAATTGTESRLVESAVPPQTSRSVTPGGRLLRGVTTPSKSPNVTSAQQQQQQNGATEPSAHSSLSARSATPRKFIACVVSQNFALKLLETPTSVRPAEGTRRKRTTTAGILGRSRLSRGTTRQHLEASVN